MMRIKIKDTVLVIAGKDKGKQGNVIDISAEKGILVGGIAMAKCHVKARKQGEVSAIKTRESYISVSNVMPICSSCNKACRVGFKMDEAGKKVRVCSGCKQII